MSGCARCLSTTRTYDATYASVLMFSGDDIAARAKQMHERASEKARGNLSSYCVACRVLTANVDSTHSGAEHVVDWCRRSAHHTEYESFAARMPCKRTLAKRMHFNNNIKTKARKKHIASVDPDAAELLLTLRHVPGQDACAQQPCSGAQRRQHPNRDDSEAERSSVFELNR